MLTKEKLKLIYGVSEHKASTWFPWFVESIDFAELNTRKRLACFLAQIGHESGRLRYVRELWGPTKQQVRYEGTNLAERLGNTDVGDGKRYMGRGLIQVTGRYNYRKTYENLSKYFSDVPNFEVEPEKLEEFKWAALSAAMYWKDRKLNRFADDDDFVGLTRAINGGTNGLDDRQELFIRSIAIL